MSEPIVKIKNATQTSADLYFYGDIVSSWWGTWDDMDQYPENIKKFLDNVKDTPNLNIYVNSGGGSVFAGMAIYNMLKRHKAHKTVYVDGLAASIASVIALVGDIIIIPANAYFMVHKAWAYIYGNSDDARKMAENLDAIDAGIMSVYKEHMRPEVNESDIAEMVAAETWLTGNEAAKYFNVEVSAERNVVACATDMFKGFKNIPKALLAKTPPKEAEQPEAQKPTPPDMEAIKAKAKLKLLL